MLRRLNIKQFALIESTELEFSPRFNILSGETGAGKSIIIGAVSLILGGRAYSEQVREGANSSFIEALFEIDSTTPVLQEKIETLLSEAGLLASNETGNEAEAENEVEVENNTENIGETLNKDKTPSRKKTSGKESHPNNTTTLIISREIFTDNRSSIARVNGRIVPLSFIRELGTHLMDLHGQHQHQSLLSPEKHLQLLDAFGHKEIGPLKHRLKEQLTLRKSILDQLNEIGIDNRERERRLDLLKFQIDEIETAALQPGEEEELLQKEKFLNNAEKITAAVTGAYSTLTEGGGEGGLRINRAAHGSRKHAAASASGSSTAPSPPVRDTMGYIIRQISDVAAYDDNLQNIIELLQGAAAHLEEASQELSSYISGISFDPRELAETTERLELIRNLKRKYGETVEDIIQFAEECRCSHQLILESEERAARLESALQEENQRINEICATLSQNRRKTAVVLQKKLEKEFPDLALKKARIETTIKERAVTEDGADSVEFLFSANPGEPLKPLANIISGGEASRVMIALKAVFAAQDHVATLIFDEADAGIGGAAIINVAEKLAWLSRHHQIMVVTHSPQIAAMADNHYLLTKEVKANRTISHATLLKGEERRKKELARMLDDGPEPVNLEHAAVLLKRGKKAHLSGTKGQAPCPTSIT